MPLPGRREKIIIKNQLIDTYCLNFSKIVLDSSLCQSENQTSAQDFSRNLLETFALHSPPWPLSLLKNFRSPPMVFREIIQRSFEQSAIHLDRNLPKIYYGTRTIHAKDLPSYPKTKSSRIFSKSL